MSSQLMNHDADVFKIIADETTRQQNNLELIASENIVSPAVLEAMGSTLTNKYAEGYPDARYYGGCEVVDKVEKLAIARVCELFDCEYANVQPHSGSQANMAVYMALLEPGDTIMGMDLSHGGHLTHGSPVNFSGQLYNVVSYQVSPEDKQIDYEALAAQVLEVKPKLLIAGASAYPRAIDFARLRQIADSVQCFLVTDMAHYAGLIAAGVYPSPLPHSHFVTSTTHKTLRGPRGGLILMHKDGLNTLGVKALKSGRTKRWSEVINSQVFPGIQGGPLMHVIAAKAVAFGEALSPSFKTYQQQVIKNAKALAAQLKQRGIRLVSEDTDSHLLLLDLSALEITGKQAEKWLDEAAITTNKNTIPFDPLPPFTTSGIRIGTPAVTTRGMKEEQMTQIADFIADIVLSQGSKVDEVKTKVLNLTNSFPLFAG